MGGRKRCGADPRSGCPSGAFPRGARGRECSEHCWASQQWHRAGRFTMKFMIRDLLWAMLAVALGVNWCVDRAARTALQSEMERQSAVVATLTQRLKLREEADRAAHEAYLRLDELLRGILIPTNLPGPRDL